MGLKDLEVYNERGILYYILSYMYIIEGLIGAIFAFFIFISSLRTFRMSKSPHLKICFGLLVSDFFVSLTFIIMGASANINGEYIATNDWYCGLIDVLYGCGSILSILYASLLSIERGLLIIHKVSLPMWFWLSIMIIDFIVLMTFNLISISFSQMGLAELAIYCMATPDYITGYITLMCYFAVMCIGLLMVIYSYIGIAIVQRRRAWKDIKELNMDKDETLKKANIIIAKVLFLLALFLACNLIEIVNTVCELITGETRSAAADFASILMLNCNPTINCIILIQFHEPVKVSLLEAYPFLSRIFNVSSAPSAQIGSILNNSS
jgi:hypothetical protein